MNTFNTQAWTLAERYDLAHMMAKDGKSIEDICEACRLTRETAICIINKHRPGTIPTLGSIGS